MISVSNDYKTTVRGNARTFYGKVETLDDTLTDDLQSVSIEVDGNLAKAVIKKAEFSYYGEFDCLNRKVDISIGLDIGASVEWVAYGTFTVRELEYNQDTEITKATAYCSMYEALQEYDPVGLSLPATASELVAYICSQLDWTLGTGSWLNDDADITPAMDFASYTYRDVIQRVAEVSGTIAVFDTNDELTFIPISETVDDIILLTDCFSQKMSTKWGRIDAVVFDYPPSTDVYSTTSHVPKYEYRISDNPIANQDIADALYTNLFGVYFAPFEAKTIGLGWVEVGDRIGINGRQEFDIRALESGLEDLRLLEDGVTERALEKSGVYEESTVTYVKIQLSTSGYKVDIRAKLPEFSQGGYAKPDPRNVQNVTVNATKVGRGKVINEWIIAYPGVIKMPDENGVNKLLLGYPDE